MGRKWNNIKEKKAAKDQGTARIYAKQGEPDPESNGVLKVVLERAKTYSVPKHIIDRAIDKAKGGGEENFDELRYEGFGPNGSMIIVDALSNNVNRTAADVRATYGKNGGNMGVSGAVSYMFDATAVFALEGKSADEVLELLIEADVDVRDVFEEGESTIIYAEPDQFNAVQEALKAQGITEYAVAELTMLPQTEVQLDGEDLEKFERLIDLLEELEDVQHVYHNVEL